GAPLPAERTAQRRSRAVAGGRHPRFLGTAGGVVVRRPTVARRAGRAPRGTAAPGRGAGRAAGGATPGGRAAPPARPGGGGSGPQPGPQPGLRGRVVAPRPGYPAPVPGCRRAPWDRGDLTCPTHRTAPTTTNSTKSWAPTWRDWRPAGPTPT